MKRVAVVLLVLFAAVGVYAGGKSCETHKTKTVELTGTLAAGPDGSKIFHVANSNERYRVCEKTAASVLSAGDNGATVQVKGRIVSCDTGEGDELVIESAKRI